VQTDADITSILDLLLDELDLRSQQQQHGNIARADWACRRIAARQPFRTPCTIRFLPMGSWTVSRLEGRTRNLSRGGLSFLVRRVFAFGDPVELEICTQRRPQMFLAGVSVACRYVAYGYHEVGLDLRAAQPQPVFSSNPAAATRGLPWLSESVATKTDHGQPG